MRHTFGGGEVTKGIYRSSAPFLLEFIVSEGAGTIKPTTGLLNDLKSYSNVSD
jgi:hypothetical protein